MRKPSGKNAGKLKLAPVNFGSTEENRFLNGDFVSEILKFCHSVSEFKLEIAP